MHEKMGVATRLIRRLVIVGFVVSTLTLWLLVGCGGTEESADKGLVWGSFVGKATDAPEDTLVAIVAYGASKDGERRAVDAHLCSRTASENFGYTSAENEMRFNSESGAQLDLALTSEAASGTAILADGSSLSFEAPW